MVILEQSGAVLEQLFSSSLLQLQRLQFFKDVSMEQCTLRHVNNYLNTNIKSYLETSGGQSSNLHLKVVHFFNTSVN